MDPSKIKSGDHICVATLFSGENEKVNIPDLQRDYCWSTVGGLVENFLENLYSLFEQTSATGASMPPIGLIYGYFDDYATNHLQLCDGQQRLTTLFLLLGTINRRLTNNYAARLLMSDFEHDHDDHEPYLRYDIRESSLHFLTELTFNFFMKGMHDGNSIKDQPWYINDYNQDPTAQNIIAAIGIIDEWLDEKTWQPDELKRFANFIASIEFIYVDMENRLRGEETFVIINTTGEPLSSTQNLKPKVLSQVVGEVARKDAAQKWEEMESWFWENRGADNDTNDTAMGAFFQALSIYKAASAEQAFNRHTPHEFPYKEVPFNEIYGAFQAYKRIYPLLPYGYPFTVPDYYVILPSLQFLERFPGASAKQLEREIHVFKNIRKYRTISNSQTDHSFDVPARAAVGYVSRQPSVDVVSLLEAWGNSSAPYVREESVKLRFISQFKDNETDREAVEREIYALEDLDIFKGKIAGVVEWCKGDKATLVHISTKLQEMSALSHNLVRRAALALGYQPSENNIWHSEEKIGEMLPQNSGALLNLLTDLKESSVEVVLTNLINEFNDTSSVFYKLIADGELMENSVSLGFEKLTAEMVMFKKKKFQSSDFWILHRDEDYLKREPGWPSFSRIIVKVWDKQLCVKATNYNLQIYCYLQDKTIAVYAEPQEGCEPLPPEKVEAIKAQIHGPEIRESKILQSFRSVVEYAQTLLT